MRATPNVLAVVAKIEELVEQHGPDAIYLDNLRRAARIPIGTLHPILQRLVREGFLREEHEQAGAHPPARPLRVYYRQTEHWASKVLQLSQDL